ncbi:hypothetical protein CYLTODRAFT_181026 [Cylindrobasidium torrendii FP15055 ss-10]|uniref:Uncharacterized protein n=1 Tax=Cylindrobasidium torrendii FP15055 ss-10 TaxID=1314674 RepID=A0A0D7AVV8_9AGAR|nr:hypothetical protein CYLTODRAFT_181026 [Cylindrobasidium torrendii FP15055 ss-10]
MFFDGHNGDPLPYRRVFDTLFHTPMWQLQCIACSIEFGYVYVSTLVISLSNCIFLGLGFRLSFCGTCEQRREPAATNPIHCQQAQWPISIHTAVGTMTTVPSRILFVEIGHPSVHCTEQAKAT